MYENVLAMQFLKCLIFILNVWPPRSSAFAFSRLLEDYIAKSHLFSWLLQYFRFYQQNGFPLLSQWKCKSSGLGAFWWQKTSSFMGGNPFGWVRIKNMTRLDLQISKMPLSQPSNPPGAPAHFDVGTLDISAVGRTSAARKPGVSTTVAEQPNQVTISTALHEIYSAGPTSQLARCPQGTKAKRAGSSRHTSADRKWTLQRGWSWTLADVQSTGWRFCYKTL